MKCEIIIEKLVGHDKEGKIGKIHVECDSEISHGDAILTIESGKGTVKCISNGSGKVLELLVSEGDVVKKGDIVGYMEMSKDSLTSKVKTSSYSFGFAKAKKEELEVDLAVIGGGPGGYVAAIRASQLGKNVILIEKENLGGTCLNTGCIPTKTLAHTAHILENIKEAYEYGIETNGTSLNINSAIARKDRVVETLTGGIAHLLEESGVRVVKGEALSENSNTIIVKNNKFDLKVTAEKIILATGSSAWKLPIEGSQLQGVITSKELLEINKVPKSITIIGGGVIGMEFAFIMNSFGSKVTVIEYLDDILSILDPDVIEVIKTSASEKGIKILTGVCAKKIISTIDDKMVLEYVEKEDSYYVTSELILMATGRKSNIDSIDLNVLGVKLNDKNNGVQVNEHMQTNVPHIYAIGDLTNIIQLAHVASHQGIVAAEHSSGLTSTMHYDNVPSAIFTVPEIGTVGMGETEAMAKGISIKISKFNFSGNGKSLAMNQVEGFVKLIANEEDDIIIGGAIVGIHGTDMLPTISHLIQHKIKIEDAISTIYAHPTAAESLHEALLGLKGRSIHG